MNSHKKVITMSKKIMALLIGTTVLTGCTNLTPYYERPALPVQAELPTGDAYKPTQNAGDKAVSQIAWNEFFQSPHLQSLIQTALDHNRDLRVAALNIEAARAQYRIQRADLVPHVNANANGSIQSTPSNALMNPLQPGRLETYTANLASTAYELDLFGRIRSLNDNALQKYFATEEARHTTQIALIAEVANAYLAYHADRKLLDLTQHTFQTQQESYDVIKKSFDMGIGSQLDVSQAATSVETARANHAQYLRRLAQDKNALTLLVGSTVDDKTLNVESLDDIKMMQDLPIGLASDILLQRPDIRQAEYQLKAANANIGAARAAFFPRISLTASAGLASNELADLFKSGSAWAWNLAPQLTVPIFQGGRNEANLEFAKTNQKIAVAQYEKSIQSAFREVSDELAARGTYTDQLNAQKSLVAASQQSYDLSMARYKAGVDSHLTVLDSQRALYNAQQNEIAVQLQRMSNLVGLYKALGGGQR
jgi:multidrug efflux system outer membrane protein